MTQHRFAVHPRATRLALWLLAATALFCQFASAQLPDRLAPDLATGSSTALPGSLHPLARAEYDRGRAAAAAKMDGLTMVFAPSATQRAALASLLVAQQNPASPLFHQWLTPAGYGARFGMSAHDIATAEAWLQAQGFTVLVVSTGRNAISFSGTAAQVESAFGTEIHQYQVHGTTQLANATPLKLPASLAGAVSGVRNIAQFRPHALHTQRFLSSPATKPAYTDTTGDHYIVPADITTIYDINALYNAGYDGTGEKIAIVGQSAIDTSDIASFRSAAGLSTTLPNIILVPGTGASTFENTSGDESESDIDLEWSGAIAKNATIDFYYAGATGSVFDALQYAVTQNVDSIISVSYGSCEIQTDSSNIASIETILMEANAQGQTVLAAAGDQGSTACDYGTASVPDTSATFGLSVSYPASSAYATALGGTEFAEGSGSYWSSSNGADGGTAQSYIPEAAWNETTVSVAAGGGITGTGGGASVLFGKPSWQVATNVPADNARDVPDISLDAAVYHDGFLACTAGSCTSGATSGFAAAILTNSIYGGTSFDAPIFAGILAMINQKNSATAAGNINTQLYSLYGSANSVFHDTTTGDNMQPCAAGTVDCPTGTTEIGYAAGIGYDQATGLGSIDAYALANVFPASTTVTSGSLTVTATTLTTSSFSPVVGTSVTLTAAVTAAAGTTIPTGTVNFTVDGGVAVAETLAADGTATYTTSFSTAGAHTVVASYAGTAVYATSTSTLGVTAVAVATGSFTLAATNITVTAGGTGTSTVTVTPASGYVGTVDLTATTTSTLTGCYAVNDVTVPGAAAVSTTLTIYTSESDCVSTGAQRKRFKTAQVALGAAQPRQAPFKGNRDYPLAAAAMLASVVLFSRKRRAWPMAAILLFAGFATIASLTGCGSSGTKATLPPPIAPAGTYTLTLTGTDSTTTSITASTTLTLTVQ